METSPPSTAPVDATAALDGADDARVVVRERGEAIDAAIARLVESAREVATLDEPARVLGTTRRSVLVDLAWHLDRATFALETHAWAPGRAPAAPRRAWELAARDGAGLGDALQLRGAWLAAVLVRVLDRADAVGRVGAVDELDALLARIELGHVALDVGYDFDDLPCASLAACARVSHAAEVLASHGDARP